MRTVPSHNSTLCRPALPRPASVERRAPGVRMMVAVVLALTVAVSGCARLHDVWNTPVAWPGDRAAECLPTTRPTAQPTGIERLCEVWNTPVSWPGQHESHPPSVSGSTGMDRFNEVWNTPISVYTEPMAERMADWEPPAPWDSPSSRRLAKQTGTLWNTPVYTLTEPFTDAVVEVWNQPFFWRTQPPPEFVDPTPYRHWASAIDYPDVESAPAPAEMFLAEPRRLRNLQKDAVWDMPLEQAIQIALSNSHIIRSGGQFLNPGNPLLTSPDFVPSSLDPAIQESGVLFGQRGVEAALSEFDAQFTTTMIWGRDEQIQNSIVGTGIPPGQTLVQETGNFRTGLTKRLATGGVIGVTHDWNYLGSNIGDFIPNQRLFPSAYTGRVRVEARQPLWAGAGTEYTRIAGPVTDQIQGVTGVQQGVVIARINNDIELTEFEGAIRDLLRDVESLYWQLYLAYQMYASEVALLTEAVDSYRNVQTLVDSSSPFAGALEESDAIEYVYQMQARVDLARDNLYDTEAQLRRIIGLTVNDGKVIRPIDEPTIAEFIPDWQATLSEALARRVELRKQKWNIKQLELQLRAAEHLVKPRLDLVAGYQVNGFGDDLLGNVADGVTARGLGDAAATITRGDETGWNLGFEFSVPLGMRFAHTQVRNLELRLAKARAALAEAEIEISHELADTFRELDRTYLAMTNNFNRKRTALTRLQAIAALHQREPERYTEDAILRARDQLNQIEQAYLQSIVEYNVAVMELHYRGGRLLEINNIHLSEGPWDAEAEYDVLDRGYDRWHSIPTATMLRHEPAPFVLPHGTAPAGPAVESFGPAVEGWLPETLGPTETPGPTAPRDPQPWDLNGPRMISPPTSPMRPEPREEPLPEERAEYHPAQQAVSRWRTMTDAVTPPEPLSAGRPQLEIGEPIPLPVSFASEPEPSSGTVSAMSLNAAPPTAGIDPTPASVRQQLLRASAERRGYTVP